MTTLDLCEGKFTIHNKLGLHARYAVTLVQSISQLDCAVTIEKEGMEADAKSVLELLTLAAEQGSNISVYAEGPDAKRAVETIEKLIGDKFGED